MNVFCPSPAVFLFPVRDTGLSRDHFQTSLKYFFLKKIRQGRVFCPPPPTLPLDTLLRTLLVMMLLTFSKCGPRMGSQQICVIPAVMRQRAVKKTALQSNWMFKLFFLHNFANFPQVRVSIFSSKILNYRLIWARNFSINYNFTFVISRVAI